MSRFGIFLLALAGIAGAQVDTGTIAGTLTDPSGAVIAGATVTLKNDATGIETKVSSNGQGQFVSPPLHPGNYQVGAEMAGFRQVVTSVILTLNQRAVVDLKMEVGAVGEQITVEAKSARLESETSTVGALRDEKAVRDLPLNSRNFNQLIGLASGVVPAQTQSGALALTAIRGTTANSVNGLGFRANHYLVDGLDNSENHNGQGILIYPPVDAILEFRVQTSVANAEFGHGGGGTINVSYKSGGRDLHGDAFEFLRNSALDAKNFFDPPGKIAPFHMSQFGATLGGPVVLPHYNRGRQRTFFFFSYEGQRRDQALTYAATVPLAAFRAGDFSASPSKLFDPLTTRPNPAGSGQIRDPLPANAIPANRIDAAGRNLISLYPNPNVAGLSANYVSNPAQPVNSDNFDVKIDQNFGTRDQAFFRYSQHQTDQFVPGTLPAPAVGTTNAGTSRFPLHQFVASYTHTLAPNQVNEFRAGVTRLRIESQPVNWGNDVDDTIGIPGVNVKGDILTSGLTRMNVTGYEGLGDTGNKTALIVSENYQWNDAFTWVRGSHTLKFGGELGRRRYNLFQNMDLRGSFNFTGVYTSNPAAAAGTGLGLADLLLGAPQSGVNAYVTGTRGYRRWEYGAFAQDTWKVTASLTLNLGLRYEVFAAYPWKEVANRMANFVPSRGNVFPVGTSDVPEASGTDTDYRNFGPRVGVAYKLGSRAVARAAYGLFYSAEAIPATNLPGSNPPFVGSVAFTNNQFDFTGARKVSQGFDRPAGLVFSPIGANLQAIDPGVRTPYAQQWNGGIEFNLAGDVLLAASYVGTAGKRLVLDPNLNQAAPGPGAVASRRPWPQFGDIPSVETEGSSIYHSLQISAERRMGTGLNLLASYTWAHAIDNGDFLTGPQNSRNLSGDRGNAAVDLRHRATFSPVYDLPFFAGHRVLGGWTISGIASFYSGLPFTPSSSVNTLNGSGGQRPDRVGQGTLPADRRTLQRFFDITAFRTPGQFLFGNAGRGILFGPGTAQFDVSLAKSFALRERRRVDLRSEFFNLFNTPQFNNPNSSIGSPGAGQINSAGSLSTFQRTSRQIQLALKLYW